MKHYYIQYVDLLEDEKFIRWQLLSDEELNEYWQNVILNNPDIADEILRAIDYLKTTGLNKSDLCNIESTQLLRRILDSINREEKKRKKQRFIKYLSAACITILIISASVYMFTKKAEIVKPEKEYIAENSLNNSDIKLITRNESHSFQSGIEIQIDRQGQTRVLQPDFKTEETIKIGYSTLNKLVVPFGKRANLTLADGSKVWLNSGTVIEFPTVFNDKTRDIKVIGEIFIEVAHDKNKSFIVHTPNSEIEVLGTSFNVSSYNADEQELIILLEGVVKVYNGNDSLTLAPNEMAILRENRITTEKVNVSEYVSWKSGYWELNNVSIEEVLKRISKYYNIKFENVESSFIANRTCTGKLYLFDNTNDLLKSISNMTQLEFEQKQNTIYKIKDRMPMNK